MVRETLVRRYPALRIGLNRPWRYAVAVGHGVRGSALGAAALVLAVVLVVGLVSVGRLSLWEAAALAAALFVACLVWRELRQWRILPFTASEAGEGAEWAVTVAAVFPELLQAEFRRAHDLLADRPQGADDLYRPALTRDALLHASRRNSHFLRMVAESDSRLGGGIGDIGSVAVGPLNVPLGGLLSLLARAFGRTITGSVTVLDGAARVSASYRGRRNASWVAERVIEGAALPAAHELARELAYRMLLDVVPGSEHASSTSLAPFLDGIEQFDHYVVTGNVDHLDRAEESFSDAIFGSPRFAEPHFNLAVVFAERQWLGLGDRAEADDTGWKERAITVCQRALELDPNLSIARLLLAQLHHLVDHDYELARAAVDQAVADGVRSGRECWDARYWRARIVLESDPLARTSGDELRMAIDDLERARQELRFVVRRRRFAGLGEPTGDMRRSMVDVLVALGAAYETRAQDDRVRDWADLDCARRHFLGAVEEADRLGDPAEQARARVELGQFLRRWADRLVQESGDAIGREVLALRDQVFDALCDAFRFDSRNVDAVAELAELLLEASPDDPRAARAAAFVGLSIEPSDARFWLIAAHCAPEPEDFRSLCEVALAVDPSNLDALRALAAAWSDERQVAEDGEPPLDATTGWLWEVVARAEAMPRDVLVVSLLRDAAAPSDDMHDGRDVVFRLRIAAWLVSATKPEAATAWLDLADALDEGHSSGGTEHARGLLLRRLGDEAAAADAFLRTLKLGITGVSAVLEAETTLPVPTEWMFDVADSAADCERYDVAIAAYDRLLAFRPVSFRIHGPKGTARVLAEASGVAREARALAGRAAVHFDRREIELAERDCRQAVKFDPTYAYPRLTLARIHQLRGEYDEARAVLLAVGRMTKGLNAFLEERLAQCFEEEGRSQDADTADTTDTTDTADAAPGQRAPHAGARVARTRREYALEQAAAHYRAALRLTDDVEQAIDIRQSLASTLEALGRRREALAERQRAATLAANLPIAAALRLDVGRTWRQLHEPLDAEVELRAALQLLRDPPEGAGQRDPADVAKESAEILNELADLFGEEGYKLAEGLVLADEALRLVPEDDVSLRSALLDTRGWLRFRLGDHPAALEDVQTGLDLEFSEVGRRHLAEIREALAAQGNGQSGAHTITL